MHAFQTAEEKWKNTRVGYSSSESKISNYFLLEISDVVSKNFSDNERIEEMKIFYREYEKFDSMKKQLC